MCITDVVRVMQKKLFQLGLFFTLIYLTPSFIFENILMKDQRSEKHYFFVLMHLMSINPGFITVIFFFFFLHCKM